MARSVLSLVTVFATFIVPLSAQDTPQRARIKKVDPDKNIVILVVDGKDREFIINEETRFVGSNVKELRERLKSLKEDMQVQFIPGKKDGKDILAAIRPMDVKPQAPPKVDTSKLKPLTEMGAEKYQGHAGGLYPDGKNERPAAHEAAGLALAKQVRPLDADGKPSPDGKIVLLSVGMSNATQAFSTFKRLADADQEKNPRLTIVDGAQGGMTAVRIKDPQDNGSGQKYWSVTDDRLKAAGVTRAQVQTAWIKQANGGPTEGFPKYAQSLQTDLAQIVQRMSERFPNLKMIYLSSRTYGGYATTTLNPEPYAFESGLSVKWLIEQQLKGEIKAPWLSWGPYLWANGMTKRADGFFYVESDFAGDGTHPSPAGQRKVAELMLTFFKSDTTTRPWFVRQ